MSLAVTYSRAYTGITAPLVTVETHISNGLPRCSIVGLPETAVKESKDRVRSALLNSQFEFPARRITINLAPAELPKQGSHYDLAIALGILSASGQLKAADLAAYEFVGELALSGSLRSQHTLLAVILAATESQHALIMAKNAEISVSFIKDAKLYHANHLLEVCAHLNKTQALSLEPYHTPSYHPPTSCIDMNQIRGQSQAKRAIQIAAAGKHHLLMNGPPGAGKTLLANSVRGLLPPLSTEEAKQTALIASCSQEGFNPKEWQHPPFRAPHHTISNIALVGGGRPPRPGEISLAHHGVLFLDELAEFQRPALECLRQPLESKTILISRTGYQATFPAHFQLIATMNPCRCGKGGQPHQQCQCTPAQIDQYQAKISGPLKDRLDLQLFVPKLSTQSLLTSSQHSESSATLRTQIIAARKRQLKRQKKLNSELGSTDLMQEIALTPQSRGLLEQAIPKFQLSARGVLKILSVARTIADLAAQDRIELPHLSEALSYRQPMNTSL